MRREYFNSLLSVLGRVTIAFTILSLMYPDVIEFNHMHYTVAILIPCHLFAYFTFKLKLFTNSLWGRRVITMLFSMSVMLVMSYFCNYKVWGSTVYLISMGASVTIFVLVSLIVYYISDKAERQNIEQINVKLSEVDDK